MKKRILSLLTTLVMIVGIVGVMPSVSAGALTSGDFEYEEHEDGTIEIINYSISATDLTIPSEIDGMTVTSIGNSAFEDCDSLKSVTIPDSVKSIGEYAFAGCYSLTSITIPDSVISIGGHAFYGTPWLENKQQENPLVIINNILIDGEACSGDVIIIPDSVKSIGEYAFAGCYSLTSITIPDSVISIGEQAFNSCNLKSLTIPDSVKSIGGFAFNNCDSLTNITIPSSVTEIGEGAFSSCNGLVSINVSTDNKYYSSNDGILYDKEQKILIQCPGTKTEVSIPNSVQTIGYVAFMWCENLTSVLIPDSVTRIDDSAFDSCSSLTSITIPDSVTSMGDWIFNWCYDLTSITILSKEIELTENTFLRYDPTAMATVVYCYSGTNVEKCVKAIEAIGYGYTCVLLDGDYPLGDLSGDGKITTVDVGIINSFAKGTKEYTDEQFKLADANADGKITTVDVGLINKIAKSA